MFESSFFNFFKIYFFYGKIWTSILIFFLAILHLLLSHYKSFPLAFIWSCCCIYKIFCVGDFSGHFSLCCWVACQFLSSTASLSLSFILLTMKKIFVPVKDLIDCNLRCYQVIKQKLKLLLKMYSTKDLNILLNKYS